MCRMRDGLRLKPTTSPRQAKARAKDEEHQKKCQAALVGSSAASRMEGLSRIGYGNIAMHHRAGLSIDISKRKGPKRLSERQ